MKKELQDILIAFILLQFAFVYALADYSNDLKATDFNITDKIYYCLEAFVYVFWSIISVLFNQDTRYRCAWKIMAYFFGIRFVWEIVAMAWGMDVNNKVMMGILFLITFITISCIIYLPQLKRILNWIWQA